MKDKRYKDPRLKVDKFCISLPRWGKEQIDQKRGKVDRSTYLRIMLEQYKIIERPDYAKL